MVADVYDAQPAEAVEEREGEAAADFGTIFSRDADFHPGLRVNDPVPTDFTSPDGLCNGLICVNFRLKVWRVLMLPL